MEAKIQEISDQQKASWNRFSPGWKKWDSDILAFMQPIADEMVDLLKPQNADIILDIASGTGEPGLSIASILKGGKVIITDLADDMLEIARQNASKKGIKNIEFRVCDVSQLPYGDNFFDAVSCRMGFMFFPNLLLAASEIRRVLKSEGRVSIAVWGAAEKNFWVTAIGGTINRNMQIPAPHPDAPGMFRCAKNGFMMDLFRQAGFRNLSEKEVVSELIFDSAELYWTMMTEIAAPFVAALGKADDALKEKIKKEVCALVREKYPVGKIIMEGNSLVIYGEK